MRRDCSTMRVRIYFVAMMLALLMLGKVCSAIGSNGTNTTESTNRGCYDHRGRMWYAVNSRFSALPCMSCKCNANGTLTCYRSIAPIPNRQCTTNGTSTSICITRQTSTTKFKQFCFNCNTSKTEFKMACIFCSDDYNAKSYYSGESWNPSSYITCNCSNRTTNCIHQYNRAIYLPSFTTSCSNCNITNFIRAHPCDSCMNHVTGKNHSSGSIWWINSCIICICISGRTYCRREGTVAVTQSSQYYPLCMNCTAYRLMLYLRKYQCKICKENQNGTVRQHNETFHVAYNVVCRCRDRVIQCNSTISGTGKEMFAVGSTIIVCSNCSAINIRDLREAKGCNFLNRTIREGHATHVGFGEMPYCMACRCHLGKLQCISVGRIINSSRLLSSCRSVEPCTLMAARIKKTCDRYAPVNCYNRPPVNSTWMANGCEYSCDGGTLKHKIIHRPWCQTISKATRCAICPDKSEFFKKYGSTFTMCKNYTEAVYREEICDGRNDCFDKTDEEHCTAHYCISDTTTLKDKTFLWPRTRVGVVKKLDCKHINPHWEGVLYRPCKMKASKGTYWPTMNVCNCTDVRPDPFNIMELSNTSALNLYIAAIRVSDYSVNAVTMKRSLELATLVTKQALSSIYIGQKSIFISMSKTLVKVLNSKSTCNKNEEESLGRILEEKLKKLQLLRGFSVYWKTIGLSGKLMTLASDVDDLFVPELLFSKTNAQNVDSLQRNIPSGGFRFASLNTNFNTTKNRSVLNVSRVNVEKAQKKAPIHVKIIFGIDAFMPIVSLLSLFIVLFFLFSLRLPKSTKWFIRKNLFLAVTASITIYIASIWAEHRMIHYRWLCTTFVLSNYYATLTMYSWMSVEGINLIIHIVMAIQRISASHRIYAIVGWGLPLVPLAICLAVRPNAFIKTKGCIGLGAYSWLFKGPLAAFIGANAVMYAVICLSLIKHKRSSRKLQASANHTRSNLKPFLMLLPLLGVTYLLGFTIDESIVMKYIYVFVNDALGLIFAVVSFFVDSQVKESLKKMRKNAKPANTNEVKENLKIAKENALPSSANTVLASTSDNMPQNASPSMVSIIAASPYPKRANAVETEM